MEISCLLTQIFFIPAAGSQTRSLSLTVAVVLMMDDLERELGRFEDLKHEDDFSDDNSTRGSKRTKPRRMHAGESYSTFLHYSLVFTIQNLLELD